MNGWPSALPVPRAWVRYLFLALVVTAWIVACRLPISGNGLTSDEVTLRKFPYPYQAGLAISTDNHGTSAAQNFVDLHTLLNSTTGTKFGPGLGLEVANSFWFFSADPEISFTYFEGLQPQPSKYAPLYEEESGAAPLLKRVARLML